MTPFLFPPHSHTPLNAINRKKSISTHTSSICNWFYFRLPINRSCIWEPLSVHMLCIKYPTFNAKINGAGDPHESAKSSFSGTRGEERHEAGVVRQADAAEALRCHHSELQDRFPEESADWRTDQQQ